MLCLTISDILKTWKSNVTLSLNMLKKSRFYTHQWCGRACQCSGIFIMIETCWPLSISFRVHPTVVMSVLCRECPQWTLWVPYGDPLQCCMCFYRDPNYLQPILIPWGYLPQDNSGSTVLHSDKKSGYTVEYWIFRTTQKGYLHRGLFSHASHIILQV